MKRLLAAAILAVLLLPLPSSLQAQGGTIFGVARDSTGTPIADVDLILQPGDRRTRSDGAGRFSFDDLKNRGYTLFARKIGFIPETREAKLSAKGRIQIDLTMRRRTDLDTIRVVAKCDGLGITGFECRKAAAKGAGTFLDYPDIDALGERYVADVFRHLPGFFVTNRMVGGHVFPSYVLKPSRYKCLSTFVDGRAPGMGNTPPMMTKDLVAIEIYPSIDSVPVAVKQYLYLEIANSWTARRCGVLMYWTIWAPIEPPRASVVPKQKPQRVISE